MEPNLCLHLLSQILGSDNNARSNAETTFTEANEKQPNEYVLSLATILANPAIDESLRNLAVVMLRRAVMRNPNFSIWEKLTPETRQSLQNQTLEILTLTQSRKMLLQVSDMAASLASSVLSAKDTKWEGLLQLLLNWTRSNSELQREAALQIFFDLLRLTDLKQYFEQLSNIFIQAVSDSSIQVRIVALQAISQLVHITLNTSKYRNQFKPCVPKAFEIITSYNDDNEELVVKTLEILIEMAELFPDFIENYIDQTFETLLTVASNENISSSVSNLSLELLITLAENKPSYLRKRVAFLTRVIHFILSLITKVEDNDQWNLGEEYDEEDEESAIGGAAIDRLALSVGETIVPIIFNSIPGMLQSPNWTYRHAALTVISYVGEGCAELLHQNLEQIVQLILPSFKDPHPRVRWAACNTIGQMSTDFAPQLQETFHAEILHYLIAVMDDVENPRVQSYAAAAIINFCECDKEIILPYLNPLLAKLFQLLEQQKVIVVIQAITAIAAVADCVGDDFIPFYNNFMPILKTILFEATGKDQLKLRGKAIEGISIIAAVVGRDTFLPDSEQVLGVFFELYNSNLPADDPRLGFLQSAWGRICKALGKDFAKYLPLLLPSVLKSAGVDADVKLVTDTQDGADDDQWYLLEIDKDHTLAINTIVLQEKSSALSLLYWMACELKEAFFPFVSEVAPICAKSLLFFYHEEVRTTAAQIIPHLIRCTKYAVAAGQQPQQAVNELFTYFVPHFVKAIKNEIDRDVVIAYCECFTEAIDVAGSNSLTPALMERVLKVSFKTLEDFTNNRKLILHQMKTLEATGDDTDDFKKKLKEQQIVLVRIGELVGKIIETHGEVVLPYLGPINAVFEFFVKDESTLHVELQSALCYFDDLVEFAGPAALSVYESWIPYAIKFVNHPDADVRQSAAFGMGLLAEHQQQNFPHILAPVLTELNQMILAEKSRSKKNIHATENAISAMGKIISFHANQINIAQILPTWLSYLPIYEDDESATIYGMLCRFFMAYEQVLVGDNFVNLPHLVAILTFVLENPHLVADDTGNLIVTILKKILHEYPQEVVKQLWGTLPANQQSILQSLV